MLLLHEKLRVSSGESSRWLHVQVKHGEVSRRRQLWRPPPVKPRPALLSNRCMDLSSCGLERRRPELV
eukprot:29863-Eustigmatos_ZCMA.PRE.2